MELRIETARAAHLDEIGAIVRETMRLMHAAGNFQWDEAYPSRADFAADIVRGELFVALREDVLQGFICVNHAEPQAYAALAWTGSETPLVLHRMAVAPRARRGGVGQALMCFAEETARRQNVRYLRTDTYSMNEKAQRLFTRCGYRLVGEIRFRGLEKPFYCYEKALAAK